MMGDLPGKDTWPQGEETLTDRARTRMAPLRAVWLRARPHGVAVDLSFDPGDVGVAVELPDGPVLEVRAAKESSMPERPTACSSNDSAPAARRMSIFRRLPPCVVRANVHLVRSGQRAEEPVRGRFNLGAVPGRAHEGLAEAPGVVTAHNQIKVAVILDAPPDDHLVAVGSDQHEGRRIRSEVLELDVLSHGHHPVERGWRKRAVPAPWCGSAEPPQYRSGALPPCRSTTGRGQARIGPPGRPVVLGNSDALPGVPRLRYPNWRSLPG